jgi:predicted dinucleotide-utilizing enzyme
MSIGIVQMVIVLDKFVQRETFDIQIR